MIKNKLKLKTRLNLYCEFSLCFNSLIMYSNNSYLHEYIHKYIRGYIHEYIHGATSELKENTLVTILMNSLIP